ncbi:B12-binding domain-containing radical SAM protein [Candidatus Omnitrophota bacterium]
MSKIMLINPPFNTYDEKRGVELTFPLGLGYLAAILRDAGYTDIDILDIVAEGSGHCRKYKDTRFFCFGLSPSDIERQVRASSPDIVGITCSFTKRFANVIDVAAIVKQVNSKIKVIIGGSHPSAMPEDAVRQRDVDFVVIGEGEKSFLKLIDHLAAGKGRLEKIDGLAYKDNGGIRINEKREYIEDLDSIPFPLREIFPMDTYIRAKRNSVITSRGCPFRCSFCSIHCVWGRRWRARSARNVVDEIEHLVNRYKVDFISFDDDNFAFDKQRARDICQEMIDRRLDVLWNTPNGISIVGLDKRLLEKMKESGCYALNLAIESGDPFILNKVMKKTTSLDQIRRVVRWCRELGILTLGYFVIGMPKETKESMRCSFEFAKELMLDVVNVFIATPYPGSQLYEECIKKDYLANRDLVSFTAFDAVIETPDLKARDVQEFLHYFVDQYNRFHDSRSGIPSSVFKEAIRRPTRELLKSLGSGVYAKNHGVCR